MLLQKSERSTNIFFLEKHTQGHKYANTRIMITYRSKITEQKYSFELTPLDFRGMLDKNYFSISQKWAKRLKTRFQTKQVTNAGVSQNQFGEDLLLICL